MDTSAVVQAINDAASQRGSANEAEKAQLIEACNNLISSLETPEQKLMGLLLGPVKSVALRLGIDMHLLDVGAKALERGESVTLQQFSNETKCEALLIRRVIRVLTEMKLFNEIDQDVFQPQPAVAVYKTEGFIAQAVIHFTGHMIPIWKLPDYFAEKGYASPTDAFDGPFQFAMGTKLHHFDWTSQDPKRQHAFNVAMTARAQQSIGFKWFDTFPVERVLAEKPSGDAFLVDIGGGIGHLTIGFKESHPDISGKLIVQDIAPVIDKIKNLPTGIEAMVQDFFQPQPIHNAKIYLLAHVLHDWPDKQAKVILEHIRDAMGPESLLLVDEAIMPDRNVPYFPAVSDLLMMAGFSSLERTESQFRNLLDSAGLKLVNIWNPAQTKPGNMSLAQSILEVRLKA